MKREDIMSKHSLEKWIDKQYYIRPNIWFTFNVNSFSQRVLGKFRSHFGNTQELNYMLKYSYCELNCRLRWFMLELNECHFDNVRVLKHDVRTNLNGKIEEKYLEISTSNKFIWKVSHFCWWIALLFCIHHNIKHPFHSLPFRNVNIPIHSEY